MKDLKRTYSRSWRFHKDFCCRPSSDSCSRSVSPSLLSAHDLKSLGRPTFEMEGVLAMVLLLHLSRFQAVVTVRRTASLGWHHSRARLTGSGGQRVSQASRASTSRCAVIWGTLGRFSLVSRHQDDEETDPEP